MTFLELCQAARQECSIQGTGPSSVTSQTGLLKKIVDWVAKADNHIQSLHPDWNFLWNEHTENTIVGVDIIVKPSDLALWDRESFATDRGTTSGKQISVLTYGEWRKSNSLKSNQPPSSICVLPNNNLAFSAPLDDVYEFYGCYWQKPTELTSNSQISSIPERFHEIIIFKTMEYFFRDIESFDQMKLAENDYIRLLISLETAELQDNLVYGQHSPEQIVVRPV